VREDARLLWLTRGITSHRGHAGAFAALGSGAVLVGSLRVLFTVFAALIVLDAFVPHPHARASSADERFRRLLRQRRRAQLGRRFTGAPQALWVLDDTRGWASVAEHRARGVQAIPVASITGTVEASKAKSFDAAFRPDATARFRWTQLWLAQAREGELAPIAVYRVGDQYVVRDGHHRVSVARDLGVPTISAEVVELVGRDRA